MKTLFIPAKSTAGVQLPQEALSRLPKRLGIVCSIQHLHKMAEIKEQLPDAIICGQVLGCNAWNAKNAEDRVDAFLFIGSGIFHPLGLARKVGKPIFCYNPFNKEFKRITNKEIDRFKKRTRGQVLKFLDAKSIGIIVSTKRGQKNLARALALKEQTDKECYIFACDVLDAGERENFSFIDCWVNTACPRISDGKLGIVNIDDLQEAGIFEPMARPDWDVPIWMSKRGLTKSDHGLNAS